MSERASDGVRSEVKPLGAVELLAVQAHARYFAFHGPDHTFTSKGAAAEMLRLCATIRQLEQGLAAVTAERDDLEGLVTALQSEETIATTELVQVNRALAQVESADNAALAEMTRERDVYKRVADILSTYGTRESAVLSYRAHAAEARRSDAPNKWRVSQHYEALAEALAELPSLDLIPEVML